MHGTIYQLGTSPINADEYMNPETISEGESVCIGYADEIAEAERKSQMEELVEILPKGMFTLNNDLTLTYNGGIDEWRLSYAGLIKEKAEAITPDNCLFITDYGTGYGVAERSIEFMRLINLLNPGDRLYAGLIADYYF